MNIRQQKNINRFASVRIHGGFTLVETLVAISILLIAVVGPMSAISRSLMQMSIARDQMIAINLAQEGIEAVRQKRDSNVLEFISGVPGASWMKGLNPVGYEVDVGGPSGPLVNSCGGACDPQPVVIDTATGLYRQSFAGAPTQFSRVVKIDVGGGGGSFERKITSKVTWLRSGTVREVVISESLFDWTGN